MDSMCKIFAIIVALLIHTFSIHADDNIEFVHKDIQVYEHAKYGNLQDILRRGELVVCALERDYNEFFQMKVNDGYVGEDIRFATALGKALGIKVVYKMLYKNQNDIVDAIANGKGDIGIAKISYTIQRSRKVSYSNPYVNSRKMIMVNRLATAVKQNSLNRILNNPNTKIAVMKNTSYESFAKYLFKNSKILSETDWENGAIKKLISGKVTAIMRDELRIKPMIMRNPKILINFLPIILKNTSDSISAISNISEQSLIQFVNKFLENEYKKLSISEIIDIYKGYIR